jgi:hypothetical protein
MILKTGNKTEGWVLFDKIATIHYNKILSSVDQGELIKVDITFDNGMEDELFFEPRTNIFIMSDSGKTIEKVN